MSELIYINEPNSSSPANHIESPQSKGASRNICLKAENEPLSHSSHNECVVFSKVTMSEGKMESLLSTLVTGWYGVRSSVQRKRAYMYQVTLSWSTSLGLYDPQSMADAQRRRRWNPAMKKVRLKESRCWFKLYRNQENKLVLLWEALLLRVTPESLAQNMT